MKTVYRIVTPILAVGSIAMGVFLKLFHFTIGNADDQIQSIVNLAENLIKSFTTKYEYSVFEIIKMAVNGTPNPDAEVTFAEVVKPIMSDIITFSVLFGVVLLILVAIGIVASLANTKKKRLSVIIMSGVGIVVSFACIIVSNSAFEKIMAGQVNLSDLVSLFSENPLMTLATALISITEASLSAGFYAVFGMFMLIIIWTILSNYLISSPIHMSKKAYKRKKPIKSLKAIIYK